MGLTSGLLSLIAAQQHNVSVLFFEFEELALIAGGFLVFLIYLFYVKYPYNQEDS